MQPLERITRGNHTKEVVIAIDGLWLAKSQEMISNRYMPSIRALPIWTWFERFFLPESSSWGLPSISSILNGHISAKSLLSWRKSYLWRDRLAGLTYDGFEEVVVVQEMRKYDHLSGSRSHGYGDDGHRESIEKHWIGKLPLSDEQVGGGFDRYHDHVLATKELL